MMNAALRLALMAGLSILTATQAQSETLLVGNKGEDTVSFIDLATGTERARAPTGKAPHEVAISPDGKQAAVVAYGGSSIDIFDVASAKLAKRIDISPNAGPHGLVWLSDGRIVAAAERSQSVVILNPKSGAITAIPTGQKGSHMLAVSPDRRHAYVSNMLSGTVSILDLKKGEKVGDIQLGGNPEGLALTPDGKQLWVGDDMAPKLNVVDVASRKVIATLPVDPIAIRVAISPDGKTAITSNFASGTLNLFDVATRKPLRTIRVSGERAALQVTMAFGPKPSILYVAETGRDRVAEVDLKTGEVKRRLIAGKNGDGLAIAP